MLLGLRIRDFIIVDRLELLFQHGFTVLTGETGAGKSILIDALSLVLGEKAEPGMVRSGAEKAEIEAEFDLLNLPAVNDWLQQQELDGEEVLLLRRTVDVNGRTRAFINGRSATAQQLKEVGEFLIDIHGQHAHQSLLRLDAQRQLLDAYAGQSEVARQVRQAYSAWMALLKARRDYEANAAAYAAEREQLQWQINELQALECTPDSWSEWQAEHARLSHAASLIEGSQQLLALLAEDDSNCLSMLGAAQHKLAELAGYDGALREYVDMLASADILLREAAQGLRRYGQRVDLDPSRLQEIDHKLQAAYSAARKYRVMPESLAELLQQKQQRLLQLGAGGNSGDLLAQEQSAENHYLLLARQLSAARQRAAQELSQKISQEMHALAMSSGRFVVQLNTADPSHNGLEQVEFLVSANQGMEPRPLHKVASGGELSRISLALQVTVSQVASVPVLVFDEVDVGIGGGVAEVVGKMLRRLGEYYQVLCVTHLPQVASRGNQHWRVSKQAQDGQTRSRIEQLDMPQRVEEIARMLGGLDITETTRKHAAEMLTA
jgi:DNA repair protein RecN (Recombination protein N)